jgi:stearoyl-CoA desaturase (delta-9 desaturase)
MPFAVAARPPVWYRAARVGLALTPLVAVHAALVGMLYVPPTLTAIVLLIVVTRVAGFGITVGFHRLLAHRAFRTPRWVRFLLAAAGCTALQKGPLWWVIHHRLHHRHSDKPGDPHSPVVDSLWYAHSGWLFANDLTRPDRRTVKDLTAAPELVWLDRLWVLPGLLLAGACYLAGGWAGVVYGYCLGAVLVFQVTFAVNSFGHRFGPQRYATGDGSRNNLALGVLALGDGWHNNHHRAPTSARHGFAWYEFDQSYLVIRLLRRVGLAWDVREPPPAALAGVR